MSTTIHLESRIRDNEDIWIYPTPRGARAYLVIDGATVVREEIPAAQINAYIDGRVSEGWRLVGQTVKTEG